MYTEQEAKTKWCPFARLSMAQSAAPTKGRGADMGFAVGSPSSFNRVTVSNKEGVTIPDASLCVGSACMAWRWFDVGDRVEHDEKQLRKPEGELNPPFSNCPEGYEVSSHDSAGWFWCRRETSRQPPRGYCGAFGTMQTAA